MKYLPRQFKFSIIYKRLNFFHGSYFQEFSSLQTKPWLRKQLPLQQIKKSLIFVQKILEHCNLQVKRRLKEEHQVSIKYGSYSTWYLTRSGFLRFCKTQWNSIFAFLPNYHLQKPVSNSKLSERHLDGEKSPHLTRENGNPMMVRLIRLKLGCLRFDFYFLKEKISLTRKYYKAIRGSIRLPPYKWKHNGSNSRWNRNNSWKRALKSLSTSALKEDKETCSSGNNQR